MHSLATCSNHDTHITSVRENSSVSEIIPGNSLAIDAQLDQVLQPTGFAVNCYVISVSLVLETCLKQQRTGARQDPGIGRANGLAVDDEAGFVSQRLAGRRNAISEQGCCNAIAPAVLDHNGEALVLCRDGLLKQRSPLSAVEIEFSVPQTASKSSVSLFSSLAISRILSPFVVAGGPLSNLTVMIVLAGKE